MSGVYLEAGGAKRFLEPVIRHFGVTPLAKIDQDGVDKGARKLYPNASDATRLRQFYTPVSAVLQHAVKRGWCAPLFLERLIDAAGDHLKPLVQLLLLTGARLGEALWLDWREVDLVRGHVAFLDTKNGESRGVPLHPRLVATLANLQHREGCVFRRPDGLPYERTKGGDDTSSGGRIKKAFAGACRRAGIADFSPHDCRHTWATWHHAAFFNADAADGAANDPVRRFGAADESERHGDRAS